MLCWEVRALASLMFHMFNGKKFCLFASSDDIGFFFIGGYCV